MAAAAVEPGPVISSFHSSRLKHSLYPEAPGFPWCLAALSLTARSLEEGRILEAQPRVPYPLVPWAICIACVLSKYFRVIVAAMRPHDEK